MRYSLIFILASCYFYISCKETTNTSSTELSLNEKYRDSSFNFIRNKFGLPHSENYRIDSNYFVFYGTRTFDTSFLIELKKTTNGIIGAYYEVLPNYHNNVNHFSIEENQLLFFEGYSFTLDSATWGKVKGNAEKMLLSNTSFESGDACSDCPEYVLCYNLKSSKSDYKNIVKYEAFYKFLKDLFIENFIQRRKPIKFKIK